MKKKSESASAAVGDADQEIPRMTRAEMRKGMMGKYAVGHSRCFVGLDRDVAKEFRTAKEINEALRLAQKMRQIGKTSKRRKSA
ncbi:MAG TPA: hypothetical protein VHX86_03410 [Tepidisphaeraceae bacterium]|jgi:hypothetical protein|nr:hypothetical protein [Tepidisphaeraceae bacterium]